MTNSKQQQWERFKKYYFEFPSAGLALDLSRLGVSEDFFKRMEPAINKAFAAMEALEKGEIANPDEKRMVGHYWLRNPALSPTPEIRKEIEEAGAKVEAFAAKVHDGRVFGKSGRFKNYLLIGIGGSALGPQFVANALGHPAKDKLKPHFFDNTDPDGMERVLAGLQVHLGQTLCIVVSKSGGTKETRNGMLEAKAAYEVAGLDFAKHAVATTQEGSELDKYAVQHQWLERFPMWDWVGGRTSELSTVGLLPAALQGINVSDMLKGAELCDNSTRIKDFRANPAALLALSWYCSGNGRGEKCMVVLPYKDRLELFSKYLQQLIMESLGKEKDVDGKVVHQGISVFGNKGSTDQHSYVQQLRDGLSNFFAVFIEVLRDQETKPLVVEPNVTTGDYLQGFYLGTRQALAENSRESVSITIESVNAKAIGMLIALFERAVGLYASLVNVNAYHQPGVESGKKAAAAVINLQLRILNSMPVGRDLSAEEIAREIGAEDEAEHVFKVCEHLAANGRSMAKVSGGGPEKSRFKRI
jgi:glucose-6-phosphate isomerase